MTYNVSVHVKQPEPKQINLIWIWTLLNEWLSSKGDCMQMISWKKRKLIEDIILEL